jgi:hypothetical protein
MGSAAHAEAAASVFTASVQSLTRACRAFRHGDRRPLDRLQAARGEKSDADGDALICHLYLSALHHGAKEFRSYRAYQRSIRLKTRQDRRGPD